jgi:hypothetical protein
MPDDTKRHVADLIEEYFATSVTSPIITSVFYTDNVVADSPQLEKVFDKVQPNDDIWVMQDVWHAQQRIVKLLSKRHNDYGAATKAIKAIFGRCLHTSEDGGWNDIEELSDAIEAWRDRFSSVQNTALEGEALVNQIGTII